jgi:hypothetical protein
VVDVEVDDGDACRAAITALLKRQKPMAWAGSAWWPGGRMAQKAFFAAPAITLSTPWQAPPAACAAAMKLCGDSQVSGSMATIPSSGTASRTAAT